MADTISDSGFWGAQKQSSKTPTLEDKARFYKKLVDSIADVILVLNREGDIVYHNLQFEMTFGYKVRRGVKFSSLAADDNSKLEIETLVRSLKSGVAAKVLVALHYGSDEKTPQRFEVAGSYLDNYLLVTLRSRLDDEITDLMRIHADRIETIQNVNSQLSHEIRSPLTVIKLGAEFIVQLVEKFSQSVACDSKSQQDACVRMGDEIIRTAKESLEQIEYTIGILKNLSAYSKLGHIDEEIIDVGETLEVTLNIIRKASKVKDLAGAQVTVKINDLYGVRVRMNRMWLSQVLWNLCMNAYEAIDPDGKIWVTGASKGNYVLIKVLNTGTIPEDKLESIFAPRFSTKSGNQGLGLAIVRNIVFKSGGHVWASNYKDNTIAGLNVKLPVYQPEEELDDCDSTTRVITLYE